MIHEVTGDILLTGAQAIVHGVGPNDPMDGGLAKALREVFPAMHKDFHHWCHVRHPEPGAAWLWDKNERMYIICLLTQEGGYGHGTRSSKATPAHINHALHALKKLIGKHKLRSLSMPRIGAGKSGLAWDQVAPLIYQQLADVEADIYLYVKHEPRHKAAEEAK